jgi:hypothetical protein
MRPTRLKVLHGAVALWLATLAVASAHERLTIHWESSLLTVSANDVPLRDVLAEVARVARVEMVGLQALEGNVTIKRQAAPLDEVLAALIGERPHVVTRARQPAAGSSGITLEFPRPGPRDKPSTGTSQDMPAARQVTEETWFDAAGQPAFLLQHRAERLSRSRPDEKPGR